MDVVFGILAVAMTVAPIAVMAAWFAGAGFAPLGEFVRGRDDSGGWWRSSLPWPRGVQEEDGVRWGTRQMEKPVVEPDPAESIVERARVEGLCVPPTRVKRRIRGL